jgi:hypothetical protein
VPDNHRIRPSNASDALRLAERPAHSVLETARSSRPGHGRELPTLARFRLPAQAPRGSPTSSIAGLPSGELPPPLEEVLPPVQSDKSEPWAGLMKLRTRDDSLGPRPSLNVSGSPTARSCSARRSRLWPPRIRLRTRNRRSLARDLKSATLRPGGKAESAIGPREWASFPRTDGPVHSSVPYNLSHPGASRSRFCWRGPTS